MKPEVQNQVIYKILKSKQDSAVPSTSQKVVSLHTAGRPTTVHLNPSSNTQQISIQIKTIDEIHSQASLTLNQTKILTGSLRPTLGRKLIPSNY